MSSRAGEEQPLNWFCSWPILAGAEKHHLVERHVDVVVVTFERSRRSPVQLGFPRGGQSEIFHIRGILRQLIDHAISNFVLISSVQPCHVDPYPAPAIW